MKFLTIEEFKNIKVYELDDVTYKRIERAFIKALGERIGKRILERHLEKSLRDLTCQSYVDVMSLLTIIG